MTGPGFTCTIRPLTPKSSRRLRRKSAFCWRSSLFHRRSVVGGVFSRLREGSWNVWPGRAKSNVSCQLSLRSAPLPFGRSSASARRRRRRLGRRPGAPAGSAGSATPGRCRGRARPAAERPSEPLGDPLREPGVRRLGQAQARHGEHREQDEQAPQVAERLAQERVHRAPRESAPVEPDAVARPGQAREQAGQGGEPQADADEGRDPAGRNGPQERRDAPPGQGGGDQVAGVADRREQRPADAEPHDADRALLVEPVKPRVVGEERQPDVGAEPQRDERLRLAHPAERRLRHPLRARLRRHGPVYASRMIGSTMGFRS